MMPGGWGIGGGFQPTTRRFEEQYHCYSVAYADKAHLEKGDKILLPTSAFDLLSRLRVDYPMLFRLTSADGRTTHCGVLEFTAEEGCCYIPFWMMQNLLLEEGSLLTVANVSLAKAKLIKLQPQSVDFLEISNPRAVLEHALRNFSCVTVNDVIQIPYNGKNFHLELKDVQPGPAACIIETDCNVDFDAPVGYVEPQAQFPSKETSACPSPSPTETTTEEDTKPKGIRIVDGAIVRPDDGHATDEPMTNMLADRTGGTGVQRNAAIPEAAPEVDYWALAAGDGARLDGKQAPALKNAHGEEVNVRQLRAEAAARRAAAMQQPLVSVPGKTVAGEAVAPDAPTVTVVKRKNKRVGTKYSRLKNSSAAFQGSSKQM